MAKVGDPGSIWQHVEDFIAAVKGGNFFEMIRLFADILRHLTEDERPVVLAALKAALSGGMKAGAEPLAELAALHAENAGVKGAAVGAFPWAMVVSLAWQAIQARRRGD